MPCFCTRYTQDIGFRHVLSIGKDNVCQMTELKL